MTTQTPLYRVVSRRGDYRQDIRTDDILFVLRERYGDDVTMGWLPGKSGKINRVRRGRKVVATVARLED